MKTTALESPLHLRLLSILLLLASNSLMINALACHPDQIQALLQFKNEFDSGSCSRSDYLKLKGVHCDNRTGAVTKLQLPSGCLSGSLKPNSSLFGFHHLRYLNLSHNNFISSSLPFEFGNLDKLEVLSLSSNGFIGQVPSSFSNLTKLTQLDLSDNKLTGSFQFVQNLTNLSILDLSGNTLSAASLISSGSEIAPKLSLLMMKNCNISEFPKFLKTLQNLERLDISSNRIKGKVPEWLWSLPRLEIVNLSNNSFDGFQGSMDILVNSSVKILELGFNSFKGSFPNPPLSINILSAPNSGFTGNIPLSICSNPSFLDVLDLSFNQFTGEIPSCLSNVTIVNLRGNSLEGSIPDEFYRGASTQTFDVGYNRLVGKLPRSLLNCSSLRFLNVYHNRIEDTFPFWLKALPNFQSLIIRSNRFYGSISPPDQSPLGFPELRVLELSSNNFSGNLPSNYFQNWKASTLKRDEGKLYLGDYNTGYYIYQDSLDFQYKGSFLEQSKVLAACATINFSGNRLKGQIPESIGLLKALIALNLSNNAFIGTIPKSLANLKQLESLDLSSNQLSGNIPQGLGSLSFLAIINVSHNHLKGEIPKGPQISGQSKSSFEGNAWLCGLPLEVSCFTTNAPPVQLEQEDEEQVLNTKAVVIGYGPGMLLGLAIGQVIASYKPNLLLKINPFK